MVKQRERVDEIFINQIVDLYFNQRKGSYEIAGIVGRSANYVRCVLKRNGYTLRTPSQWSKIRNKRFENVDFYDLYVTQKLDAPKIAKIICCNLQSVYYYLKRRGIIRRDYSQSKLVLEKRKLKSILLGELYSNQKKTMREIAKELGCSSSCVKVSLKRQNVKSRSKSEYKLNDKNPQWKGEKAGYGAIHNYVKRRIKKERICNDCKREKPLDMANISQEYKREVEDWEWLCRRCHMKKDGRLAKYAQMMGAIKKREH